MKSKLIGRILLATGLVLVTALAASAIYVAAGIRYPAPAGLYEVGRTRIFVKDESRDETFSDEPGDQRELPVTVYYPAAAGSEEPLAGSMDLARVGIFGHSFGGAAAVAAARENPEILAAVNMDGTMFGSMADPLTQPVMLMMNEQGISQSALFFREKVEISETSEACYHLLLRGSTHDSFATDSGLIYDKYSILRSPEVASIGGFEALDSLTAYLKAFFDQYLSGVDSELLNQAVTPDYIQVFCVRYGYEIPDSAEVSHEE